MVHRPSVPMTQQASSSSPAQAASSPSWSVDNTSTGLSLTINGEWKALSDELMQFPEAALTAASPKAGQSLLIDPTGLKGWDSGFIMFLWNVKQAAFQASLVFDDRSLPSSAQRLLALLPGKAGHPSPHQDAREGILARIGGTTLDILQEISTSSSLLLDVLRGAFRALRGKSSMRLKDLLVDVWNAGPSALLIVSIVNFLIGAILAFVGLLELRKFAAQIYVTNLVGIASAREISAIMTAIIMAGRTGGAYAARISTMQGNEEIDALQVTGISVAGYILLPSILSLILMMPLLYLYGTLVAIFGGFVVSMTMMDLSPTGYWLSTFNGVELSQFAFGFIKALFFAGFIALAACRIGLKAGRSAADVGIAATRAVVIGIVGVIALDAIFAVLANAVGI